MEDMQRHREQATVAHEVAGIIGSPSAAQAADSTPADALERLHWMYMDHQGAFGEFAALEQPGVEVREAVKAVLALPPDVLSALGAITSLSEEDRRTIRTAVALPPEVQATIRTILG